MSPAKVRLYGLLGLMTLFWSVNYVAAKIALKTFPALLITPLRNAIAALCFFVIYHWAARAMPQHTTPWKRSELPLLALLGIVGIGLNQVLFILGMSRTTVAHASLVVATTPVQVLLLARLRGLEKLTPRKWIGMAVAIGGVLVLNLRPGRGEHGATPLGDLLVWLASFTFALYTVAGREISERHGSITVNTMGFAAGAVAMIPLGWWQSRGFDWGVVTTEGWMSLVYMSVFGSVAAYLIFSYALGRAPASRVASFAYAQPVFASVIGLAVLGEPITTGVVTGGLLILAGVYLVGRG